MKIQVARPQDRDLELSFERQTRLAEYIQQLNQFGDEYKICRAIMRLAEPQSFGASLEEEVSREVGKCLGIEHPRGLLIPTGLRFGQRALTTVAGAGGQTVFTAAGTLIEMLRNLMQVTRLGATVVGGLVGPVSFPSSSRPGRLAGWLSRRGPTWRIRI